MTLVHWISVHHIQGPSFSSTAVCSVIYIFSQPMLTPQPYTAATIIFGVWGEY